MDNKGMNKSLILVFVILIVGIVSLVVILNLSKNNQEANPLVNDNESETQIIVNEKGETQVVTTTKKSDVNDEKIVATNFNGSLNDIIGENDFNGNYNYTLMYSGAKFEFKCTNFDEEKKVCLAGSADMNVGTAKLNLFNYNSDYDNYLLRSEDYYIMLTDKNIILITNYVGVIAGTAKIYDRNGNYVGQIPDVITGYRDNGMLTKGLFPNLDNNEFNYYTCDNNVVKVKARDMSNINTVTFEEIVDNSTCY